MLDKRDRAEEVSWHKCTTVVYSPWELLWSCKRMLPTAFFMHIKLHTMRIIWYAYALINAHSYRTVYKSMFWYTSPLNIKWTKEWMLLAVWCTVRHLGIYLQMLILDFKILGCFYLFIYLFIFCWEGVWCLNGLDNGYLSCDSHYRLSLMCTLKVVCWHFQLGTSKGLARHACCSYVPILPRIMS